jgi:hypothetical protein
VRGCLIAFLVLFALCLVPTIFIPIVYFLTIPLFVLVLVLLLVVAIIR